MFYKALIEKPKYYKNRNDPPVYGFICPMCQKRWGMQPVYIDVKRCENCPPFTSGDQLYWNQAQKIGYRRRRAQGRKS